MRGGRKSRAARSDTGDGKIRHYMPGRVPKIPARESPAHGFAGNKWRSATATAIIVVFCVGVEIRLLARSTTRILSPVLQTGGSWGIGRSWSSVAISKAPSGGSTDVTIDLSR